MEKLRRTSKIKNKKLNPPETILSHTFFINNTEEFYKFYKTKMNTLKYQSNITHKKLAEIENI